MPWRHRFRFRLLTLFVAVTALCLWLGVVSHRARTQKAAVARLELLRADVFFDYQNAQGHFNVSVPPPGPQWARRILGDDYFRTVRYVRLNHVNLKDSDIAAVAALGKMTRLDCSFCNFSSVSLAPFARLKNLRWLRLVKCHLGENSLAPLARMPRLEGLQLLRMDVDDSRLPSLAKLTRLKRLDLVETRITGDGFSDFERLTCLADLTVAGGPFGDHGMKAVALLPALKILTLTNTAVTDRGLADLARVTSLEYLLINGKAIHANANTLGYLRRLDNLRALVLDVMPSEEMDESLNALRKALPDCDIDFEPLGVARFPRPRSREFPYPGMGTR